MSVRPPIPFIHHNPSSSHIDITVAKHVEVIQLSVEGAQLSLVVKSIFVNKSCKV